MNARQSRLPNLASALWPASGSSRLLRGVTLALVGTLLLAVSAKTQVPFWPVPMTMQTFVVLALGAVYGPRLAGATVALYLAEGAMGLPVFAGGGGLVYFAGPTTGYLFGFLVAAVVVGVLAERGFDRRWLTTLVAFVIGTAIIFAFGVAWLASMIGFERAIAGGLVPFLPGAALKIALAMAVLPLTWKAIGRKG